MNFTYESDRGEKRKREGEREGDAAGSTEKEIQVESKRLRCDEELPPSDTATLPYVPEMLDPSEGSPNVAPVMSQPLSDPGLHSSSGEASGKLISLVCFLI